jgi:transcriptional regulator with XRE-family HTH domain
MDNPVLHVRNLTGETQVDFARRIGRHFSSVQGYESGRKIPAEVIDKLKSIAVEFGHPEIAAALSRPGERLISNKRAGIESNREKADNKWHSLLDEVLNSGNAQAIAAVQHNLVVFSMFVQQTVVPAHDRAKRA